MITFKDKYIKNCLSGFFKKISSHKIYDSENKKLKIKLSPSTLPIIAKSHHKTQKDAINFIRKLDTDFASFDLPSSQDECGTDIVIINKSFKIELQWGKIDEIRKSLTNLKRLKVNPIIISLLSIGDDLEIINELTDDLEKYRKCYEKLLRLGS